ncbi:MAG: DoxX family protein [Acidobacteria bacterium]|nr:DoxX family protein [Acidobacteriota bacterium]
MDGFLNRYASYVYAILRIVTGFLFMLHGTQKLFGYPPSASGGGEFTNLMAVGGAIELIGGLLIMIGLFTGIAAFISSGTMAVAYFMFHSSLQALLPIVNKGELAVVYCFLFLYIAARGSGVWSVDSIFRGSGSSSGV